METLKDLSIIIGMLACYLLAILLGSSGHILAIPFAFIAFGLQIAGELDFALPKTGAM